MRIKLIVIRTDKIKELAKFYSKLGLKFEYHKHGKGPMHYSSEFKGIVFEIYPLRKSDEQVYNGLRLGFEVEDLDNLLVILKKEGVKILKDSELSEWGYYSVIEDVDGRKIELNQKGGEILKSLMIETKNYRLRIPKKEDIPFVFSATRYKGFNDGMLWEPPESEDELIEPLRRNEETWGEKGYSFAIEEIESKQFLGRISIRKTVTPDIWDVGFWTHPEQQNKGVMTEVLEEILRFGFQKLKAEKIEACHALWNKASERVLKKHDFKFEEYLKEGFRKKGEWIDENKLSISRSSWIKTNIEK